jgi:SAM-dependent methyltransferase
MATDPSPEENDEQETTARVVKPGALRLASEDAVERYEYHFVHLIGRHLALSDHPGLALDLACGNGFSTLTLAPQLPHGSRVIAIGDDRAELKLFHEQIDRSRSDCLFPRKERTDRLPFAAGVFDTVWAALSNKRLDPLKPSLRQALRVLKPNGTLLIAAPLRDTFVHLASRIGNMLNAEGRAEEFRELMTDPPDLLTLDDWQETLTKCGATRVEGHRESISVSVTPPLSSHRLFTQYLLPLGLGDDPTLQAHALRLFDQYLTEPAEIDVYIGCVTGVRGHADIEESSLTTY